ncbi:hypothetical protein [Corynebacterium coyleae]|uniref:hypothetical protein n=1 Tax=Corynebacterium coyleae TaxID=53374 RepID=UPI00254BBFE5|nr:hypothetical protein [Corynebacterium coyleae]MDK8800606.1 hypothetical protein [Corynebacterium coyleae]
MEKWKIKAAVALCLASATATGTINPVPVLASEQTMASRANPKFCDVECFSFDNGSDGGYIDLIGIPSDVEVDQVRFVDGDGKVQASGYTSGYSSAYLSLGKGWYRADPFLSFDGKAVSTTKPIRFLVDYVDGSTDSFTQALTFPLDNAHAYKPKLDTSLTFEKAQKVLVGGLPNGTRLSVVNAPEHWIVSVEGEKTLLITPDRDTAEKNTDFQGLVLYMGEGILTLSARFPDGSKAEHEVTLRPQEWVEDPSNPGLDSEPPTTETLPATSTTDTPTTIDIPTTTATPIVTEPVSTTTVTVTTTKTAPVRSEPTTVTTTATAVVTAPTTVTTTATAVVTAPTTVTTTATAVVTAPVTITKSSAPERVTVTKQPEQDSRSSSTGSIVALILGALGLIGGISAAALGNPQLRSLLRL